MSPRRAPCTEHSSKRHLCRPSCSLQDVVAGDGTTSVVVICGALLKKAQELLEKGIHPTVISDAFNLAANKACEVRPVQCSLQSAASVAHVVMAGAIPNSTVRHCCESSPSCLPALLLCPIFHCPPSLLPAICLTTHRCCRLPPSPSTWMTRTHSSVLPTRECTTLPPSTHAHRLSRPLPPSWLLHASCTCPPSWLQPLLLLTLIILQTPVSPPLPLSMCRHTCLHLAAVAALSVLSWCLFSAVQVPEQQGRVAALVLHVTHGSGGGAARHQPHAAAAVSKARMSD